MNWISMRHTFAPSHIKEAIWLLEICQIIYKPYLIRFSPHHPKHHSYGQTACSPYPRSHSPLSSYVCYFHWLFMTFFSSSSQRELLHLAYRPTVCRWVSDLGVRILSRLWAIPRGKWLISLTSDAWRVGEHPVSPIIFIDMKINNNVISGEDILTTQFITPSLAVAHHCKQVAIAESVQFLDSSTHCSWCNIRLYRSAISLRSQFGMFWIPAKMWTSSSPFIILTFLRQITKVRNAIWRVLSHPANLFFTPVFFFSWPPVIFIMPKLLKHYVLQPSYKSNIQRWSLFSKWK